MDALLKRILERSVERRTDADWRPSIEALRSAWPGLVGERLDGVTEPRSVDWDDGELVVAAATDTWRRELQRHDRRLLERLGEILPWRLERVEFVTGAFEPAETASDDPHKGEPAPADLEDRTRSGGRIELPEDLEDSLDSLEENAAASARRILEHVRDET